MQIHTPVRWRISESFTMVGRCMRHTLRNVDTILTMVILPVSMMLLFVYVFGGAIDTGTTTYIDYVVPGIILLCIGYCASTTAVSIHNDMSRGIVNRFQSMPITKSSVLHGHVIASLVRNICATILVMGVAFIMGFRTDASVLEWLFITGILLLYTLTMTWASVIFGLLANSAEGAGAFSFVVLFLPYLSSAFVPTEPMPTIIRIFAENQPVTPIIEAIRSLLLGTPVGDSALIAVIWCAGILIVSYGIAIQIFEHKTKV